MLGSEVSQQSSAEVTPRFSKDLNEILGPFIVVVKTRYEDV